VVLTDQRMPAGLRPLSGLPAALGEHAPLRAFRDWLHPEIRKYLNSERSHARRKARP
jgi:hypothetical protein